MYTIKTEDNSGQLHWKNDYPTATTAREAYSHLKDVNAFHNQKLSPSTYNSLVSLYRDDYVLDSFYSLKYPHEL